MEEDLKECTFTPNDRKSASRSFRQLYHDLTSTLKTETLLRPLNQHHILEEENL
jgi:hypothetical protein